MELLSPGTTLAALMDTPSQAPLLHASPLENLLHPTPAFLVLVILLQIITILGTWLASKLVVHRDDATFINALKVWLWSLAASVAVNMGVAIGHSLNPNLADPLRLGLIQWGGIALLILLTLLIRMKIYVINVLRALIIVLLPGFVMVVLIAGFVFTVFKVAPSGQGLASMATSVEKLWTPSGPTTANPPVNSAASTEIDQLLNTALHPAGAVPSLAERVAMVQVLQQKLQSRRNSLDTKDAHDVAVCQNQFNRYLYFRNMVIAEQLGKPAASGQTERLTAPAH